MKKYLILVLVVVLFVCVFAGCGRNYSYEEREVDAVVIQCEEGKYHPDPSYIAKANICLIKKNFVMRSVYISLANENGKYDYNITINIEGVNYIVVREEQYEVGDHITITQVDTYQNLQLIKTEYK